MWDQGLSLQEASATFDVRSLTSISEWERQYISGEIEALSPRRRGRLKKMPASALPPPSPVPLPDDRTRSREELLDELNYLRMENAYLKKFDALIQADKLAAQNKKRN
jgi:transposase